MKTVLIIEDDAAMAGSISNVLRGEFDPIEARNGKQALDLATEREPDLILLDLNLPDTDGFSLCRRFREDLRTRNVPIIMISGEADPDTRVVGLETGADDYVCKPFHARELLARIHARFRRENLELRAGAEVRFGNLRIEPVSGCAWIGARELGLTPFELRMLIYFIERESRLVSRAQCLADLWPETVVSGRTVDAHVARLRRKLEGFDGRFTTVHRVGYRLERSRPPCS